MSGPKEEQMVFKGCARCGGDMYREEDIGQTDLVCLQCGYRVAEAVPSMAIRLGNTRREVRHSPTTKAA
jgi:DNA-directed RNA polymerase subunit RPC12/RpoP